MHAQLIVPLLQLLELLLSRNQLGVNQVHLLCRYHFIVDRIGLSGRRSLSPNVIQGVFVVHFEVGVLKLPRLRERESFSHQPHAVRVSYPRPIGRSPSFFIVVSHFVEVVLVQLAHEAGEVAVLEVFGEYVLCELFILRYPSACVLHANPPFCAPQARRMSLPRSPIAPRFRPGGSRAF